MRFSGAAREWLAQYTGTPAESLHITQMKGSTSSSVFLIEGEGGVETRRAVLRVLDNAEWLADEPDLAEHEAAALQEAQRAGLRAPELVAFASEEAGFGAPVVLMSYIEGNIAIQPADFQAWLTELARELATIHRHPADTLKWGYRSWVEKTDLKPPTWTTVPYLWEHAIEQVRREAPETRWSFIHRDYHPTNVLWQAGRITGVVDWINACRGPAGVDVAHCASNLAMMFGPERAEQFFTIYRAVAEGFDYHPYFDLDSVLDMSLPQPTFYAPWKDFGLDTIAPEVICQRMDAYLERLLQRA